MMRSKHKAGYTLLELMVVVTLMGTMAVMAAPSLGSWRNDARHQDAAYSVLRVIQRGQELANVHGYAHMVRLTAGPNGRGRLDIVAGMTSRCLKTPWGNAPAVGTDPNVPLFDMDDYNPVGASRTLTLTASVGGNANLATTNLCIEPTGRTFTSAAGALAPQAGLLVLTINGADSSNNASGAPRVVIVEPGGRARSQR